MRMEDEAMEHWVLCRVYPGQFSVEYAVVVRQADGGDVSLFVPQDWVECEGVPALDRPVSGWLRVALIEKKEHVALVFLPRSTLENGQYVTIHLDQLEARP